MSTILLCLSDPFGIYLSRAFLKYLEVIPGRIPWETMAATLSSMKSIPTSWPCNKSSKAPLIPPKLNEFNLFLASSTILL